jgi:hypothetical protein
MFATFYMMNKTYKKVLIEPEKHYNIIATAEKAFTEKELDFLIRNYLEHDGDIRWEEVSK